MQQSKARLPSKGLSWASLGRHEHAPLPTGRPGPTLLPHTWAHVGIQTPGPDPPLFPQAGPERVHTLPQT